MKVRHIEKGWNGVASDFNVHSAAPQEMIVYFTDEDGKGRGDCDSDYCKDYDVWIEALKQWKPFFEASKDHDIITDNYNTIFFEPSNDEDRKRGFTL